MRDRVHYPDSLKEAGVTGTLRLRISLDGSGQVAHAEVLRSLHPVLDAACLQAARSMPLWKPAQKAGKPVGANLVLPVTFR